MTFDNDVLFATDHVNIRQRHKGGKCQRRTIVLNYFQTLPLAKNQFCLIEASYLCQYPCALYVICAKTGLKTSASWYSIKYIINTNRSQAIY